MRKCVIAFWVLVLMSSEVSAAVYGTNCYQKKDTSINKTGDWFATFGKTGNEKKRILDKRKRDRFTACVQKNLAAARRHVLS